MAVEIRSDFYSSNYVVVSKMQFNRMLDIVKAVESVFGCKEYQGQVFSRLPDVDHVGLDKSDLFLAYDFHVNQQGVGLIEVNTNPGGALLSAALTRGLPSHPPKHLELSSPLQAWTFESELIAMFEEEWQKFNRFRPLKSIAIIDENPDQQFLFPEFLLFQELFLKHGIDCVIADPSEVTLNEGSLWVRNVRIDLVYNRLTDFYLEDPAFKNMRQAYVEKLSLVTPNPASYALYADKRNLVLLTDKKLLNSCGIAAEILDVLEKGIPVTQEVNAANEDVLWTHRRNLYFKPNNGFGARAVYRGDKITKKVWSMIRQGQYVAQKYFAPGEVSVAETGTENPMKFDVRLFVYGGRILWVSARVYQGQATNFRTPGGGFAQVFVQP